MTRADVFTEEAMTRPLFEELTGDHAREDEWSGPHGFALGGMMQANAASLAEEYFAAANELVDAIKDKRIADYRIGNAALFLYRHSCELILKAAMPDAKRVHDLIALTDRFVVMVKERYGQDVPAWIVRRMKELAAIDPGSTAFRYGVYGTPIDAADQPIEFEAYVSMSHLQAAMLALNAEIVIRSSPGERVIPAADFFVDMMTTALAPNEILTEIRIPAPAQPAASAYLKVAQAASGFAVVGVAVQLTLNGTTCEAASVAVNGLAPKAFRAAAVESALLGQTLDADAIKAAAANADSDASDAMEDIHASGEYRRHLAKVYTGRAVQAAASRV